ncbi:MAG: transposase [Planctomycetaceae bacterium]|nr:transposase [Planctomycetaceae bacterium]
MSSAFRLEDSLRIIVQDAVIRTAKHRDWRLLAVHVRTTHVHIVVVAADVAPERVMNDFKAYATRSLRQVDAALARVWSRHGSTRYLWTDDHVCDAMTYVVEKQGRVLYPLPYLDDEFRRQ